jgi:hypothetical protein
MTTRTTRRSAALRMSTFGDLRKRQWQPREYVIGPWLRDGESAMLWAETGVGKTMTALTMALAVAGGGTVFGWKAPKPRPVLYLDGEMHVQDLYDRLEMLAPTIDGLDMEAVLRNLVVLSRTDQDAEARFPDLASKDGQDTVLSRAADMRAELVICDNFSTLAEVADENEAAAMTPVLSFLMRVKQAGRATILVHHSDKKGVDYRGSSKLAATFEVIIGLHKLDGRSASDGAGFELDWRKYRGAPTSATRNMIMELAVNDDGSRKWVVKPAIRAEQEALMEALQSGQFHTGKELAAHLGWDPAKVSNMKRKMIVKGVIAERAWEACLKRDEDGVPDF